MTNMISNDEVNSKVNNASLNSNLNTLDMNFGKF